MNLGEGFGKEGLSLARLGVSVGEDERERGERERRVDERRGGGGRVRKLVQN